MLRSFIGWLDSYLAGEEPAAVVKAAIGLMSFAALLGVILGSTAIKAGLLVAVLLVFLSITLILLRDRRKLLSQRDDHARVIARLSDDLVDHGTPDLRLVGVEHILVIDSAGDVQEIIRMRIVPAGEPLRFITHRASPAWAQPSGQLKKVCVEVRAVSIDGRLGPKCALTQSWRGSKMILLIDLNEPAPVGSEVVLEMAREWPGKCAPLMRQLMPEPFTYHYSRPVDRLSYAVVLPRGVDVYCEPIGFCSGAEGFSLGAGLQAAGRTQVTFVATDLPADHRVGMRLEVKRAAVAV